MADLALPIPAETLRNVLEGLLHVDALEQVLGALAKIAAIFVGSAQVRQRDALEGEDFRVLLVPLVLSLVLDGSVVARAVVFLRISDYAKRYLHNANAHQRTLEERNAAVKNVEI